MPIGNLFKQVFKSVSLNIKPLKISPFHVLSMSALTSCRDKQKSPPYPNKKKKQKLRKTRG